MNILDNIKTECSICKTHVVTSKDTKKPICINCYDIILAHPEFTKVCQVLAEREMQSSKQLSIGE